MRHSDAAPRGEVKSSLKKKQSAFSTQHSALWVVSADGKENISPRRRGDAERDIGMRGNRSSLKPTPNWDEWNAVGWVTGGE